MRKGLAKAHWCQLRLQMAYLFGFHTRQGINSLSHSLIPLKRTNEFS
jgi:hypothetical protein